jgi:hypothetical protein
MKLLVSSKDYSQYSFNGRVYNKRRIVLAIIKQYLINNPNVGYSELERGFPRKLQGSLGVFARLDEAKAIEVSSKQPRHFLKERELLTLKDGTKIAVCTQWGANLNIENFLGRAKELGFKIEII